MNTASHPSIRASAAAPSARGWPIGALAGSVLLIMVALASVIRLSEGTISNRDPAEVRQAMNAERLATRHSRTTSSNSQRIMEATIDRLHGVGMQKITVCSSSDAAVGAWGMHTSDDTRQGRPALARCSGSVSAVAAAAAAVAAASPQAVVFDGNTSDAAAFIEDLRAHGSFALVVLMPSVDPQLLVTGLSTRAKVWLAVTDEALRPPSYRDDASRVRMGILTANGAILDW